MGARGPIFGPGMVMSSVQTRKVDGGGGGVVASRLNKAHHADFKALETTTSFARQDFWAEYVDSPQSEILVAPTDSSVHGVE